MRKFEKFDSVVRGFWSVISTVKNFQPGHWGFSPSFNAGQVPLWCFSEASKSPTCSTIAAPQAPAAYGSYSFKLSLTWSKQPCRKTKKNFWLWNPTSSSMATMQIPQKETFGVLCCSCCEYHWEQWHSLCPPEKCLGTPQQICSTQRVSPG